MGGFGSGRPSGFGRAKVEHSRSLDVNRLHREGCLNAGWIGGRQWTVDGKEVASIGLRAECGRLHLTYRIRIGGGERCRNRPYRPPRVSLRRNETLFRLPRRRKRQGVRTAGR